MPTVNQVFQSAPMGRRVLMTSVFAGAVLLLMFAVNVYFVVTRAPSHLAPNARLLQVFVPLVPLALVTVLFLFERSRISQFSIEDDVLVLGRKRFAMKGLVGMEKDPDVMRRAIKKFGNGGLGSIRGRFWSRRLGNFYAFMTGTENAVVLRWPDKVVAVSPTDPEFFIYSARAAAGLK